MAEYIKRETLLEYLDVMISALSFPLSELGEEAKAYVDGFKEARSVVERFPTVDAAPVVHGRWGSNGIPDSMLSACSVCGFGCGAYSFRYYPNCGARMDGAE